MGQLLEEKKLELSSFLRERVKGILVRYHFLKLKDMDAPSSFFFQSGEISGTEKADALPWASRRQSDHQSGWDEEPREGLWVCPLWGRTMQHGMLQEAPGHARYGSVLSFQCLQIQPVVVILFIYMGEWLAFISQLLSKIFSAQITLDLEKMPCCTHSFTPPCTIWKTNKKDGIKMNNKRLGFNYNSLFITVRFCPSMPWPCILW